MDWEVDQASESEGHWEGAGPLGEPFRQGSYLVTALGEGGEASERTSLVVLGPPIIKYFLSSSEVAPPGAAVELRWEVAGAAEAEIDGQPIPVPTGRLEVTTKTDRYVILRAANVAGEVSSAVRIRPASTAVPTFTPTPTFAPASTETPTPTAYAPIVITTTPTTPPTFTPTSTAMPTFTPTFTHTPTSTRTPTPRPSVVDTITVDARPVGIARRPSTGWLYVPAMGGNVVDAIDPATRRVIRVTRPFNQPVDVGISPDSRWLYVANRGSNYLNVVDLQPPLGSEFPDWGRSTGASPYGLAVAPNAPNGLPVVVANSGTSSPGLASVISSSSSSWTATVGDGPRGVVILPNASRTYVANTSAGTVTVFSGIPTARQAPLATIKVGGSPIGIAAAPKSDLVYVANRQLNSLQIIDVKTNAVVATVRVGSSPVGVAAGPEGRWVYVMNEGSDDVSVVEVGPRAVRFTLKVGNSPQDAAITPDGNTIYVTNLNSNSISVIQWPLVAGVVPIRPTSPIR